MSSDTDHLRDVTEPYGSTGPGDAGSRPDDAGATARESGSTLPPPPARPVSAPVGSPLPWASTAPGDTRPVAGGRAIDWPSAPPSGPPGPGDRPREDDVPSWVPRFEQPTGTGPDPTGRSPFGAPSGSPYAAPPGSAPPPWPATPSGGSSRGRALYVAILGVVALLAGLLGAVIGVNAADDDSPSSAPATTIDRNVNNRPGTTVAPPVSGEVAEPAAAVAQAVGPAVVLIQTPVGEGSGIIYDASGLIVTNAHVVENFRVVDVTLADGEIYENAEVVGADTIRDIAVVRIQPREDLTVATFGPTDEVHVGEIAIAIGSPFGLEQSVTAGIVSAVGRVLSATNPVEMIQTDAPINPGNSGGALADANGRVIGMNTAIRTADGTGGSVGVGFAIPSDTLTDIASRIVNGESLAVAYLGVRGSAPTGSISGVVILEVRPDSPAEKAGLKEGDEVRAIDGDPVANMSSLSARIQLHRPGDTVQLTIERGGQEQTLQVTLGSAGG
jgi:S1-C subfamily serine protease